MSAAPLTAPSAFVRPVRITYELLRAGGGGGEPAAPASPPTLRTWDTVEPVDSVAVLVEHTGLGAYLLARQLRPPVTLAEARAGGGDLAALAAAGVGVTYELCGGMVDKPGLSLEAVAAAEVEEELGFRVPPTALVRLFDFREAVGVYAARMTVFHAAVDDAARVGAGGGLAHEGEAIEVVALPTAPAAVTAFLRDGAVAKSIDLQHALALRLLEGAAAARGGAVGERGA